MYKINMVDKVTSVVILFCGAVLLLYMFGIASMYNEIKNIWNELDIEINDLRIEAILFTFL